MSRSKQARAREFSSTARKEIIKRDNGECIFCQMGYRMEDAQWLEKEVKSIMHYIPRAKKRTRNTTKRGNRMPVPSPYA